MIKDFSSEQYFFLQILNDYLHDQETDLEINPNWKTITTYAVRHELAPIFYHQCKSLSPEVQILQQKYMVAVYLDANRRRVFSEFKKILADIPNVQVKGMAVSELYPHSFLRTMGDIDTLIHSEDQELVHARLMEHCFTFLGASRGEWEYQKNGFLFEIHEQLVHEYKGKEKLIEYFSHAWEYVQDGVLDWNFHFIYLIEHLHQHLVGKGVGFRQFMDIAVVCQKGWIQEQLQIIGLLEFAKKVFAFNERWFAVPCPIECGELDEEFFLQAANKIFEDGVFGHDNEENTGRQISFIMTYEGKSYEQARAEYVLRRIFPGYKELCRQYEYLNRSKMLYPAAWVQRLCRLCFDKKSRKRVAESIDRKHTEDRQDLLRKWGL